MRMKMKLLLAHLSMLAFLQVLLVGFGGSLYREYLKETPDKSQLLLFTIISFTVFVIVAIIYFNIYTGTSKNKK